MQLPKNYRLNVFQNLVIIGLVIFFDQGTKLFVLNHVGLGHSVPFLPGIAKLTVVQNTGGAFSILKNYPIFFKLIGLINLFVFSYILFCPTVKLNDLIKTGGALIFGGTIGNLIDRFFRSGVVDFIDLQLFDFAVFNLADVCVDIGVALILIGVFSKRISLNSKT